MKKVLLGLTMFGVMAFGGDLEDGGKAFDSKDYKKAANLF